ncbi:chloramphenicol acetyltransferase, partial [Eubacteriales bacterium OttesenSCG-928-N13]|nr:chloramphenicol acetyltransferase [Eubacteriales bacterium OttesenSCG-928-N13]
MKLNLINENTYKRAEYLSHYLHNAKIVISTTVDIDVSRFLKGTKEHGYRFYPAFLYVVTKIVNAHEEFRMGYSPEGRVGIWDEVCPSYIIFHPDDETLTRIFTPWQDDFHSFYRAAVSDMDKYESYRGFSIADVPPNIFDVSCVPWTRYRSLDFHVFDDGTYLAPVITWGKFEADLGGKVVMPLSLQIHHAAADGFHVGRFF